MKNKLAPRVQIFVIFLGITAFVSQFSFAGEVVVATPESPDAQPTSGTVKIPARSAAVVMEQ